MSANNKACSDDECKKESCSGCDKNPKSFLEKTNEFSSIKKVIGVVSGKGGVGKSIVTSILAVLTNRAGYKSAVLDADITGPSIPRIFGLKQKAEGSDIGLYPVESKTGIGIMSVNLLLENDTDPVIWRGPIIANTVKQFWTDVIWGDIDFLFIDMPPGTGDVALTVFQSIPVDGIIIVTSPQELVSMIVTKAVNMADKMNIPILGIVENMSYVVCPDCNNEIKVFGESHVDEIAGKHNITAISKMPVDTRIAAACDKGMIELFDGNWLDNMETMLESLLEAK
ncbi:MAG: P-loop NTPase [Eubacteriales bacterium]